MSELLKKQNIDPEEGALRPTPPDTEGELTPGREGELTPPIGGELKPKKKSKQYSLNKYVSVYPNEYFEEGEAYIFPKMPFENSDTLVAKNPNATKADSALIAKYADKFPSGNEYDEYYRQFTSMGITQTIGVVVAKDPINKRIDVLLNNGYIVYYATNQPRETFYDPQDPLKLHKGITYPDNK